MAEWDMTAASNDKRK